MISTLKNMLLLTMMYQCLDFARLMTLYQKIKLEVMTILITSATVENEVPSWNEALEVINLLHRDMAVAPHVSSDVSADVNRLDNFIICNGISTARQTQITEFT